jgi:membrane fusion protein
VRSEALGATAEEVVKRLTARRDSLLVERAAQNALHDQRERDLAQRVEALRTQQKHLDSQIALQRDRLQISRRTVQRERTMRAGDLIPVARLERTEQDHLDQTARLEALERDRSTLQNDLIQVKGALQELPMLRQNALAELDRNADAVGQELAEAEARRSAVIVAPEDGIVTGILTEPGGNVTPSAPLMNLVPAGSKLQAQLFGPSGAIGFVKPGQRVSLRYESYSYQKFGAYGGTVASVSRSPVAAGDLPNQLASASPGSEPLFRVIVDLDRQTANAYGEAVPLQAGMRLDANVAIEARQLYEWILDPLYTMTGRMSR